MERRMVALALLYLLTTHAARVQCGWYYTRLSGQSLGHVFEQRHGVRTATACCTTCTRVYACVAVNFRRNTGLCELNRRSPKSPVNATTLVLNQEEGVNVYYADACDAPWTQQLASCYLFPGTPRDWAASRDFCRVQAAELVDIGDAEEDAFLRQAAATMTQPGDNGMWIGIGNYHTQGNRVWTSGKAVTYTNFAGGEPNNGGLVEDEDCIMLYSHLGFLWNDMECRYELVFACEKPLY